MLNLTGFLQLTTTSTVKPGHRLHELYFQWPCEQVFPLETPSQFLERFRGTVFLQRFSVRILFDNGKLWFAFGVYFAHDVVFEG